MTESRIFTAVRIKPLSSNVFDGLDAEDHTIDHVPITSIAGENTVCVLDPAFFKIGTSDREAFERNFTFDMCFSSEANNLLVYEICAAPLGILIRFDSLIASNIKIPSLFQSSTLS
jgi:hypothetical protein